MEGDQIDKVFERKAEEFIESLDKKLPPVPIRPLESVSMSTVLRPGEIAPGFPPPMAHFRRENAVEPIDGLPAEFLAGKAFESSESRMTRELREMVYEKSKGTTPGGSPDEYELAVRFSFHGADDRRKEMHHNVRMNCWALAEYLCANCPASRELSIALTKVEEVMLWANAAIARRE